MLAEFDFYLGCLSQNQTGNFDQIVALALQGIPHDVGLRRRPFRPLGQILGISVHDLSAGPDLLGGIFR